MCNCPFCCREISLFLHPLFSTTMGQQQSQKHNNKLQHRSPTVVMGRLANMEQHRSRPQPQAQTGRITPRSFIARPNTYEGINMLLPGNLLSWTNSPTTEDFCCKKRGQYEKWRRQSVGKNTGRPPYDEDCPGRLQNKNIASNVLHDFFHKRFVSIGICIYNFDGALKRVDSQTEQNGTKDLSSIKAMLMGKIFDKTVGPRKLPPANDKPRASNSN